MANGDAAFAASTAPLTFQSFLEKMRHPSASELVKSIKVRAVPISLSRASGRFPSLASSSPRSRQPLTPPLLDSPGLHRVLRRRRGRARFRRGRRARPGVPSRDRARVSRPPRVARRVAGRARRLRRRLGEVPHDEAVPQDVRGRPGRRRRGRLPRRARRRARVVRAARASRHSNAVPLGRVVVAREERAV